MIVVPLFLPLLVWGAAIAITSIFAVAGIAGVFKDPKKRNLGILGMQISGKTRFLSYLRGVQFVDKRTGRQEYQEFTYVLNDGRKIKIKAGVDIGGGDSYRSDYDKILDNSNVILYFFDIDKYLRNERDLVSNISYQRSCNSRFEHIYSKVKMKNQPVLVIATHKDKCNLPDRVMKQKFDDLVSTKLYKEMLKSIEYVNLTSIEEIEYLANKIFKGE